MSSDPKEIEVTPAMLTAGIKALQEWHAGVEDWPAGARSIYEAMAGRVGCENDKAAEEYSRKNRRSFPSRSTSK